MKENKPRPHARKKFVIVGLSETLWGAWAELPEVLRHSF
jgi:hypothetical protein